MLPSLPSNNNKQPASWNDANKTFLLNVIKDVISDRKGDCTDSGFKSPGWTAITSGFNKTTSLNYSSDQIQSQYHILKAEYGIICKLVGTSGFGWNEKESRVEGDKNMWDTYIASNSKAKPYRGKSIPYYKTMKVVFAGRTATGAFAVSSTGASSSQRNAEVECDSNGEPYNDEGVLHALLVL